MSNEPQDDFAAIAKPLPNGKGANTYATGSDDFSSISHPVEFVKNPKNEGTYRMVGKDGAVLHVPFSHVEDTRNSGFSIHPDDEARFSKDYQATLSEAPTVGNYAKEIVGGVGRGVVGLGAGLYQMGRHPRKTATDMIQQVNKAGEESSKEFSDTKGAPLYERIAASALTSMENSPLIGGMVQHAEEGGTRVASPESVGAAAEGITSVVAPEIAGAVIPKVIKAVPKALRNTAEAVTKTGPRELKRIAQETHEANLKAIEDANSKNADNAQKHLEKTQEALHKTQGAELSHEAEVKAAKAKSDEENAAAAREHLKKTQEALHETAGSELEHQAQVRAENEAAKSKHEAKVAEVKAHNERVIAKHKAISDRITQENQATEHALELRRSEEAKLQQETKDYYAKEDAVKAKVKSDTDKIWEPWHEKMKGVTVDAKEISEPLNKIIKLSPEVNRAIHQLVPDPADAPADSLFAQDRAAVMKAQGFTGSYWDLPPHLQSVVDQITTSSGFEPEPIDLDPSTGKGIPVEQIHRARSIINRNIASGRYEGPLLGEMKQLSKVLDRSVTRASMEHGAMDDLEAGRAATKEYQEAFGRDRHTPKTQDEIRKQQANPEQFKEENDQERLDAAKKHDASLASDYEKVKARRDALKKLPTEDQLRKSQKQVPPTPTVGDIREGYNLKPEPTAPQPKPVPAPNRTLPPDRPQEVNPKEVAPPERTAPPDKPEYIETEKKSIGPEERKEALHENVAEAAERLREHGVRRTINALYYTVPTAFLSTLLGHPGYAIAEVFSAPIILAGSHALANLIERPEAVAWLSKITPKEVAEWEKLPPEQKAVFTQNMADLYKQAKAKGLAVSPALSSFVSGARKTATAGAVSQQSVAELKKKALENSPFKVTDPNGIIHAFPTQAALDKFKKESGLE